MKTIGKYILTCLIVWLPVLTVIYVSKKYGNASLEEITSSKNTDSVNIEDISNNK